MDEKKWDAVDAYINEQIVQHDNALENALKTSSAAGLPPIAVSPAQGKQLHLLARGRRSILEIGTLGGYSTIWLARALADGGKLTTLEYEPRHAEVAQANIAAAGLADKVEILVGPALESLPQLEGPFDFVFVDADKVNNPNYFAWAVNLSQPGTIIIIDNVVRGGSVVDASSQDPSITGTRRMFEAIAAEPRVTATAIQTVGSKGYDGYVLAVVN